MRLTSGSFQKEMALIPRKDRNQNTVGEREHDKFGEPEQIQIVDSVEHGEVILVGKVMEMAGSSRGCMYNTKVKTSGRKDLRPL